MRRRQLLGMMAAGAAATWGATACSGSDEDVVTWYTDHDAQEVQDLTSAFTKESGIKVELFTSTSAGVVSKVTAEVATNKRGADVLNVSGPLSYQTLVKGKVPANLPDGAGSDLPEQNEVFTSTDGKWFSVDTTLIGIAYNADKVDPAHVPTDFTSFLDPYWKGRFSIPVSTNSTSVQSYFQMAEAPWLGREFLQGLGANQPVSSHKSGQQVSDLITGNQLGAIVNDNAVWPEVIKGAPLKYVYPARGLAAVHDYNMLVQGASSDAATRFLKFLASDTALEAMAGTGATVDVPGIALKPASRPRIDKLKFFPAVDPDKLLQAQGEMAPYLKTALGE